MGQCVQASSPWLALKVPDGQPGRKDKESLGNPDEESGATRHGETVWSLQGVARHHGGAMQLLGIPIS